VGIDVLGLVTLGMGLGAVDEVESLESTASEAAGEAWGTGARSLLEEFRPVLNFFRGLTDEDGALTDMGRTGVKLTMERIADIIGKQPEEAGESVSFLQKTAEQFRTAGRLWKAALTNVPGTGAEILAVFTHGGDPTIARAVDEISGLAKSWPALSKVTEALGTASSSVRWANAAFYSGNVAVLGDAAGTFLAGDPYERLKDSVSTYALSGTTANVLADTGNPVFEGFRVASSFMGN
jgi:hypothetical protein